MKSTTLKNVTRLQGITTNCTIKAEENKPPTAIRPA